MPTLTEGSRAGSGPLAMSVSLDDMEEGRRSPTNLLIDTMELVEPRKPMHVPNHLLETKTFTKIGQNCMVHVKPEVIHFDGFEVNEKHVKKLVILNASSDVLRMHLIPPQSKYFSIKYKKGDRMVPGLTLECTVEFQPDEWRYYYDCIRINCPGDENLIIPIHGYPIMSTKQFPRNFSFPVTAVGKSSSQVFPLRCMAPVDFEFELIYVQPHPAFMIHPMSGIVPANSEVEVTVTFAPFEFQTASMVVQLNISQFNAKPIICKFIGTSKPGLLKEKTLNQLSLDDPEVLDPRCVSPLDRARHNRKLKIKVKKMPQPPSAKSIEYKGIQFPTTIESPWAVGQVLNQEPGKLKVKDLRDTVLGKQETTETSTRQMKEARFDHAVRQNVYEERQNQLRWQVKVGDEQISNKQRSLILDARDQAYAYYKFKKREDPVPEDEYGRHKTKVSFRRTIRDFTKLGEEGMMFDPYMNDIWAVRNAALDRFIQAVRKVIIRSRADVKVKSLSAFVINWGQRQPTEEEEDGEEPNTGRGGDQDQHKPEQHFNITASRIQRSRFPTYVPPNVKDDMAADALGEVELVPTHVVVKEKVPFFNLKVPQMYRLNSFSPHSIHNASCGYVPPRLVKPLRTGAPDEVIILPQTPRSASVRASVTGEAGITEGNQTVAEAFGEEKEKESPREVVQSPVISTLKPPEALFKPIDYPPLHIINPAPGLQVFQAPMPYAEVDSEFHLCPLPRYFRQDYETNPHASTQRKYLDREDTIRGMMSWKKFPSQGLTSLANIPTLTNVWVPRWDDNFSTELLPTTVPHLFDGLPADDADNLVEESQWDEDSTMVSLTPDMVNAQFALIDASLPAEDSKPASDSFPLGNKMPATNIPVGANGPVPREKREEELEYFMTKKYNRLGSKVEQRVSALNNMLTQPHLKLQ
ncbi:LOW QUALITY PROTEIN: cilia- and flagella-associated protein 221-like [Babylonia areolata]|uniref:LOW QUALITY PROTEIN: cilia- and flagella-associated protein 221-like n=1 Tax=Babylonia areolata TaxID=304850 RepID=UPI003FD408EC